MDTLSSKILSDRNVRDLDEWTLQKSSDARESRSLLSFNIFSIYVMTITVSSKSVTGRNESRTWMKNVLAKKSRNSALAADLKSLELDDCLVIISKTILSHSDIHWTWYYYLFFCITSTKMNTHCMSSCNSRSGVRVVIFVLCLLSFLVPKKVIDSKCMSSTC